MNQWQDRESIFLFFFFFFIVWSKIRILVHGDVEIVCSLRKNYLGNLINKTKKKLVDNVFELSWVIWRDLRVIYLLVIFDSDNDDKLVYRTGVRNLIARREYFRSSKNCQEKFKII